MRWHFPHLIGPSRGGKTGRRECRDVELPPLASSDTEAAVHDPHLSKSSQVTAMARSCHRLYRNGKLNTWTCNPWTPVRAIVMLLGWYQVMLILLSVIDALCPDAAISVAASVMLDGTLQGDTFSTPSSTSPISCHSHNDYWRVRPLLSAIEVGCSSVEADVWVEGGDLLVGHAQSSLLPNRNLSSMYIKPIIELLDRRNKGNASPFKYGVFESDPLRSLVLLIDFKVKSEAIFPILTDQLFPLRSSNYLTYFNGTTIIPGPVTIVASGDASYRDIIRNTTYRDIFYDAPLELMGSPSTSSSLLNFDAESKVELIDVTLDKALPLHRPVNPAAYNPTNSYYASVSFTRSIGYPYGSRLSQSQVELIRRQIRGARERGMKVRYWDVPTWPIGVRNYLWRVLVREGVDYLNVDDIRAATRGDWGPRKGGWNRKWWT